MEPTAVTGLAGVIVWAVVQAIKNKWLSFIPPQWMAVLVPVAAAFASAGGAAINAQPGDASAFSASNLLGGAGTSALAYLIAERLGLNDWLGKKIPKA